MFPASTRSEWRMLDARGPLNLYYSGDLCSSQIRIPHVPHGPAGKRTLARVVVSWHEQAVLVVALIPYFVRNLIKYHSHTTAMLHPRQHIKQ